MADLVNLTTDTQGWDAVINSNNDEVNGQLSSMLNADNSTGTDTIADQGALTAEVLTDSTTGSATNTINDVGASFSQSTLNDNFASLVDENNKLRTDVDNLRAKVNTLLAALRQTGGVGIISD